MGDRVRSCGALIFKKDVWFSPGSYRSFWKGLLWVCDGWHLGKLSGS